MDRNASEARVAEHTDGPQGPGGFGDPEATEERDLWAWAEFDEDEDEVDIAGCQVTAVLVTHEADAWLPATLAGLEALTHRPTRLIAIDNASDDHSLRLLEGAHARGLLDAVYSGKRGFGFGEAIHSALRQDRDRRAAQGDPTADTQTGELKAVNGEPETEHWLWLLHDDAVPDPEALSRLLTHVTRHPEIDVTGPKQLLPKRRQLPQQLGEIGVSISDTGRRELHLDRGEIDQGQRDKPTARLAVSTSGMLLKRSVWRQLGGFDPKLPVFRDGVDFGWRAHLSGYRVVTTPDAKVVHRQVGRAGLRPTGAGGKRPGKTDRLFGMLVVAGHASTATLPLVWLRLVWSCVVHTFGYLIGKVPGRALDELWALGSFFLHPGRIRAIRKRVAAVDVRPGGQEAVEKLRPAMWSSLRVASDAISGAIADRYYSVAGESEGTSLDELTGDDFSTVAEEQKSNPWLSPVVIATVLTIIGSIVAARSVFGLGNLSAPALLPARGTLGDAWNAFLEPMLGSPGLTPPPWLGLVAIGSTITAGRPEWFITLLLCGVVPLSLISVYPVVRRVIDDRKVRLWAGGTYALLPVVLGGTNQGRLVMSVFACALPLLVLAGRALVLRRPRSPEAWRGGWGAGLVLVALVAFEPSLIIPAVVLGVIGAVTLRRTPRKIGRIVIALAVPLVVLAPWWPSIVADWGRMLTGPDAALDGAPAAPSVWQLFLGRGLGEGLPPIWLAVLLFGAVWLVALVGLGRRPRHRAVIAGWIVALLSFTMAVVVSHLVVSVPPLGTAVRPWPGVYVLIAFSALVLAGAVGVDRFTAALGARSFSFVQPAAVLVSAVIALITVAAGGWWIWGGMSGPIDRTDLKAIPPYVLNAQQSDLQVRTLAIDLSDGGGRYEVIADDQIRLGDAERGFAFGGSTVAHDRAEDIVVRLVAGTGDEEIASQLADLGIGFIWVTGASEEEKSLIDNTPGLGTASGNNRGTVWRLADPVSRATLVDGDKHTAVTDKSITLGRSDRSRELRLGEPADSRWRATMNGEELKTAEGDNWQQVFVVPGSAGTVTYELDASSRWWPLGQGIAMLIVAILAAPAVRRPEVRDPAKSARRAAIDLGAES